MAAVAVGAYRTAATAPAGVAAAEAPVVDRLDHERLAVLPGEPPPYDEPGRRWPWLAMLLVLLLAGGGLAAYLLTRPVKAVVPTVVNEPLSTASAQLQNANFNVSTITVPNNNKSGTVIRQNPQGGTKLKEGSTVTLTVSSGPGNATVPSVEGLSLADAKKAIDRANLKPGRVTYQSSDQVPKGEVISSDPGAGQTPPVGTGVTMIVSSGKPLIGVPDVTGQSEAAAKAQLQNAGFTVGTTTTQVSSTDPPGNVIGQSPAGGTRTTAGTPVNLVIAKAPPPATANVPDVTGKPAAEANSKLTAAGFKVTQQTQTVTKKKKDGVVISENPPANTSAKKGSTVTIVVGQYQAPTTTPTTATTPTTPTTTTTPTTPTTTG
jgi:serine/threonine-protein kinase